MVDNARLLLPALLLLWAGAVLLLGELRWFRRVSLTDRLLPFSPHGLTTGATNRSARGASVRAALTSIASLLGERISAAFGVRDPLDKRLRRVGASDDVGAFRLRQFGWAAAALALTLPLIGLIRPPLPLAVLFLVGAPLLACLTIEQALQQKVTARRERTFRELPVVSEQLAMLLGAGFSLGSALQRLAERGGGVVGQDLYAVVERMRHGVPVDRALQEWAELVDIPEVDRFVDVLVLGPQTSDLGRLVSDEARSIRQEAQRRLSAEIDKRSQQVWVPVTVATLVPGVIFLTIPFLQALELFAGT